MIEIEFTIIQYMLIAAWFIIIYFAVYLEKRKQIKALNSENFKLRKENADEFKERKLIELAHESTKAEAEDLRRLARERFLK